MGAATIVCVEVERPSGRLRKWEDTLSAHVGQVDPGLREQEAVRCLPMDERPFMGRIEYGALGEMLLCKFAATNYRFTRSLTTPTPTLPIPMMLVSVSRGSVQICPMRPHLHSDRARLDPDRHEAAAGVHDHEPRDRSVRDHAAPSVRCSDCRPLRAWRRTSIERQVGIVAGPARHGERELRRDAPSSTIRRKKTGRGHYHDGMGRLARTDRDAAGDRTPRRTTDAGQGLYRGESRRSRALRRANRARMQHFRSWAAPPFRRGSGRIRIALSLAASAHPLRGGASRPEPGASLDNRRLLLIRLQQFVAFQPAVQGSVRSSAGSLSRRAGLAPSGDPGSMLAQIPMKLNRQRLVVRAQVRRVGTAYCSHFGCNTPCPPACLPAMVGTAAVAAAPRPAPLPTLRSWVDLIGIRSSAWGFLTPLLGWASARVAASASSAWMAPTFTRCSFRSTTSSTAKCAGRPRPGCHSRGSATSFNMSSQSCPHVDQGHLTA